MSAVLTILPISRCRESRACRLAQGIAAQAAIAIDNARLYAQAKKEIAERKAVEVELQLLNAKLEARIAERTTELVHEINER